MTDEKTNIPTKTKDNPKRIEKQTYEIKKVELITDAKREKVLKYEFHTDTRLLTYKPQIKTEETSKIRGIPTKNTKKEFISVDNVHDIMVEMHKAIHEYGVVKAIMSCGVFVNPDTQETHYWMSDEDFNNIKLVGIADTDLINESDKETVLE